MLSGGESYGKTGAWLGGAGVAAERGRSYSERKWLCRFEEIFVGMKSAISHVPPVLPVSFSDLYAPPFFTLGEILPEPYFSIIQMPDSTFVHFHLSVRFFIQILHLPVF